MKNFNYDFEDCVLFLKASGRKNGGFHFFHFQYSDSTFVTYGVWEKYRNIYLVQGVPVGHSIWYPYGVKIQDTCTRSEFFHNSRFYSDLMNIVKQFGFAYRSRMRIIKH